MKLTKAGESTGLEFIVSTHFSKRRAERTEQTWSCSEAQSSDKQQSVNKE